MTRRLRAARAALSLGLCLAPCMPAAAATPQAVRGVTTTQDRSVLLPGVEVRVLDLAAAREVRVVVSDGEGRFRADNLPPGRYRLVAHLPGFTDATADVELPAGRQLDVPLDLKLAPLWERVNVEGRKPDAQLASGSSPISVQGSTLDVLPVVPGSFQAALPILPGVLRAPDGQISVKGARPTQAGLQVGQGSGIDPSTGTFGLELPSDAIESVEVVGNPYRARDGGFASSIVKVESRGGTDQWAASVRGLVPFPCLTLCDGRSMGIRRYEPRIWVGGPLRKDRLFIAQGVEYRWNRYRVPSLPEDANDLTLRSFNAFTRLDVNLSPGHAVVATLGLFSRQDDLLNLNTFNPAEVTPNLRLRGTSLMLSDTATLTPATVLETTVSVNRYHVDVLAQGDAAMELTPDGNRGNYFNTQERQTDSVQVSGALTRLSRGLSGEHLFGVGFDLMHSDYAGSSVSRPVLVRRADLSVSQRIEFGDPTRQQAAGTSAAFYAQDRWRASDRVLLEPGIRVDRDGVTRQTGVSPRLGAVLRLGRGDDMVLRGGVGVFRQRTPLLVGAFDAFEAATVTRYASDGTTAIGPSLTFLHRTARLGVARSLIWNVEFDQRIGPDLFVKINHMRRKGSDEAVVEPLVSGDAAALRLDSSGQSRYAETELTLRYGASEEKRLTFSYVRSHAAAASNAFDIFYGNVRNPIVRPGEYASTSTDVPNRLLVTAVWPFATRWTVSGLVEVRDGFPYSVVDENQEFVGARNAGGRFPVYYTLDAKLLRTFTYRGRKFRLGIRSNHLFGAFSPRDVQNNIDSPAFRTFYNSYVRLIAFTAQWIG